MLPPFSTLDFACCPRPLPPDPSASREGEGKTDCPGKVRRIRQQKHDKTRKRQKLPW